MVMATNNRRVAQMLWLVAGLLFVFALLHSFTEPGSAKEWASGQVESIVQNIRSSRAPMPDFMATAEASFEKAVRQRHEMIAADWGDSSKMPLFPCYNHDTYVKTPYTIWDFTPATYSCPHEMERVGRMGDGGKWVCGMSQYVNFPKNRECVIYSFGVRDESSFEQEMLERTNCVVWAYDFSVVDFGEQVSPENRDRAHFLRAGIAGHTDEAYDPPFYSIADLMKMNGHDYVDILKMDIEGSEFESMDALSEDFPVTSGEELPIGQFMVEIHLRNGVTSNSYLDWWERLESRGLRATWTEPNLLSVTLGIRNKDPVYAEYTMINAKNKRNILFM